MKQQRRQNQRQQNARAYLLYLYVSKRASHIISHLLPLANSALNIKYYIQHQGVANACFHFLLSEDYWVGIYFVLSLFHAFYTNVCEGSSRDDAKYSRIRTKDLLIYLSHIITSEAIAF